MRNSNTITFGKKEEMMDTIASLWWLPLITVPALAMLIMGVVRKKNGGTGPQRRANSYIGFSGLLFIVAGLMMPAVISHDASRFRPIQIVLLAFAVLIMIRFAVDFFRNKQTGKD